MKLKKILLLISTFISVSLLSTIIISCQKIKNNQQENKKEINNKIAKLSTQYNQNLQSIKLKNSFTSAIENIKLKNSVKENVQVLKISARTQNKETVHQKNTKWISNHPWISLGIAIGSTFVFMPFVYAAALAAINSWTTKS
ncbi:hypothetical protein [Mycoplasma phocimorsus]|uniref:hypothetical protein n=1 Tax=Mycoplasma phocimorsus TaxID=3045839 RepID=UPI0024C01737|nr:hypothetical protein [Mycoplasma phocimorsus]MDJ1646464.1 hypothetical protein [Mycoplasma phocimorsus]MDJ1648874.1 hypothetical protein [Mycoplasma phocimorsus]